MNAGFLASNNPYEMKVPSKSIFWYVVDIDEIDQDVMVLFWRPYNKSKANQFPKRLPNGQCSAKIDIWSKISQNEFLPHLYLGITSYHTKFELIWPTQFFAPGL